MGTLWQDVKYSFRTLVKSPGFTIVAVISLAVGIGANTVIFSAINGVLLNSLPVRNPDELRVIGWTGTNISGVGLTSDSFGRTESGQRYRLSFPYPVYRDFAEKAEGLSDLFAFSYFEDGMTISADGVAAVAHGLMVSGNFFSGYGVRVLIGRAITPQDDRADVSPTAVISHRFWQRYYTCDPHVLGRTLMVNNVPFTIIGVLSQRYRGPLAGDPTDFYLPITAQPQLASGEDWLVRTDDWWVRIMGRMASGAGEVQARYSLEILFRGFLSMSKATMDEPTIVLADGKRGLYMSYAEIAFILTILQGLVGLILLIACANVASLLLARGAARQHELSIRAALGAGRWRLIRLSLVESLILSLAAGAVGLVMGIWIKVAVAGSMANFLARTQTHLSYVTDHQPAGIRFDPGIDGTILAFVLGVALLTTFVFGLAPALRAGHVDPSEGLKDSSSRAAPRLRLGKGLIAVQAGLSMLLVFGAGLMTRTIVNLHAVDPGFDTENLLIFQLNPLESLHEGDDLALFFGNVRETIAGIPGVQSVALSQASLLGASWWKELSIPGRPNVNFTVPSYRISDGWFDTMGVRLLSGRDFSPSDTLNSQPVAIINEAFARKFFPEENPLGLSLAAEDEDEYQIVGLCSNHKSHLRNEPIPILYRPNGRFARRMSFAVQSRLPPISLVPAVRRAVAGIDRNLPLEGVTTQVRMLKESMDLERLLALFCGGLALLALSLSCIGLGGLMAYNVTRRTNEIGIRIALGARPRDVAWSVLREAIVLAGMGIALGIPMALALALILGSIVFGIAPYDPTTMLASALVLVTVSAAAAWIPACRAAKIDPMEALRYE
jgi:predicted permease